MLLSLPGCRPKPDRPESDADPAKVPQQVLEGITLRQTSSRGLLWILYADSGKSYGPDAPTLLRHLKVRFFDGGPDVRSVLTSLRGSVDSRTQTLIAEDSVRVVTPEGDLLETQSLQWDPRKERILTEARFKLTRRDDVLTGVGLEADPDLSHYEVHREVRAEMRGHDDESLLERIDADTTRGR